MKTIVSEKRLLNYIRRTPGLTTCQLCRLLRGRTETEYTKIAFSARLLRLEKAGKTIRLKGRGATSDKNKTWRHYAVTSMTELIGNGTL